MKLCHNIKASVFCNEEEDENDVLNHFLQLFPFNIEKEKIKLKKTKAKGFNEKIITIFEIALKKDKHINSFLEFLNEKLNNSQKELILKQLNSRLDNDLNLFLRFDKNKLLKEDRLWLTGKGNCFHFKIAIAVFPKKKEKAISIIQKIFKLSN